MSITTFDSGLLGEVRRGLRAIGYSDDLLRDNYRFADYSGSSAYGMVRSIDLAAFGQEPLTTKTACIGIVSSGDRTPQDLIQYRALGAHQLLTVTDTSVDRWKVHAQGSPTWLESIPIQSIAQSIAARSDEWGPQAILRAKAVSLGQGSVQLDFFDRELIPTIERVIRTKLNDLLSLAVVETNQAFAELHTSHPDALLLFRLIFRLLAAKLLADREHPGHDWIAGTPAEIINRVETFYFPEEVSIPSALTDPHAQKVAWEQISRGFHLQNVSLDSLAWIWENTFVTPEIRDALGIHGTPPEVAEYVVRRLPFASVPLNRLRVFEPCVGQAAFLVAALGRIRELLLAEQPTLDSEARHDRFVQMLSGMDIESFAMEIARLSLMLADYPHPAGWDLRQADVLRATVFSELLAKSSVVLCNPPFGKLSDDERSAEGVDAAYDRAAEVLKRVLADPPDLLGFVLPRVFRNGKAFRSTRQLMAQNYQTIEVTELPDRLFSHSEVESVLVLAHGQPSEGVTNLQARTVRRESLASFLTTRETVPVRHAQLTPAQAEERLWIHELDHIWSALRGHAQLGSIAVPHRGIEWKIGLNEHHDQLISGQPRPGFRLGVQKVTADYEPFFVAPRRCYLNTDPEVVRRQAHRLPWHLPKVLVNRHRRTRRAWTLTAVPDYSGLVAYENFHGVWPTGSIPVEVVAAILNGHVANAFMSDMEEKRNSGRAMLNSVPIPALSDDVIGQIIDLVSVYRTERAELLNGITQQGTTRCIELLATIDGIVLKAYGLTPELEAKLLDYFADVPRPGLKFLTDATSQLDASSLSLFQESTDLSRESTTHANIADADTALDSELRQLEERLKLERPELFDEFGVLRWTEVQKTLEQRAGRKASVIEMELAALTRRRDRRSTDAP